MDNNYKPDNTAQSRAQNPDIAAPNQSSSFQPSTPSPSVMPQAQSNALNPQTPKQVSSPAILVLQWLTYAFWGWTVLGMSILTVTVLASFMDAADTGEFMPYGIAAILVLLPISVVCDFFYSKHEPDKKSGASSVIMIIHAVLFALFAIGSLIAVVFSLVSMFTSSSDMVGVRIALFSSMIITFLYLAVFLRTIKPVQLPWIRRTFVILMIVIVGLITILGIVGPVRTARVTRTDKLIAENLSRVQSAINDYVRDTDKLPSDLGSIELNGDAQKLVTDNLVTYKQDNPSVSNTTLYNNSFSQAQLGILGQTYYYQLCVTYKAASPDYNKSTRSSNANKGDYDTYVDSYSHPSGEVCYKLKTSEY